MLHATIFFDARVKMSSCTLRLIISIRLYFAITFMLRFIILNILYIPLSAILSFLSTSLSHFNASAFLAYIDLILAPNISLASLRLPPFRLFLQPHAPPIRLHTLLLMSADASMPTEHTLHTPPPSLLFTCWLSHSMPLSLILHGSRHSTYAFEPISRRAIFRQADMMSFCRGHITFEPRCHEFIIGSSRSPKSVEGCLFSRDISRKKAALGTFFSFQILFLTHRSATSHNSSYLQNASRVADLRHFADNSASRHTRRASRRALDITRSIRNAKPLFHSHFIMQVHISHSISPHFSKCTAIEPHSNLRPRYQRPRLFSAAMTTDYD